MPALPELHHVQIVILSQPDARRTPPESTPKPTSQPDPHHTMDEPTLTVLFLIVIALVFIFMCFAVAIVIVRIQRRYEARKAAYDAEVPPPYDDGLPAYTYVPKDDDTVGEAHSVGYED